MSVTLDARLEDVGTRFRLFPQPRFLGIFDEPEVVYVSIPPSQIQAGPADDRMYVVDAKNKLPYTPLFRPPYAGEQFPKTQAGPDGHFDHLDPDSREFSAAMMYATVHRVLDIWEDYFGHHIAWHFEPEFARLELIPLIEWDNAQSGYGFLEFGYGRKLNGGIDHSRPYCQNFDVIAHEFGHGIIFSEVGVPSAPPSIDPAIDYGGMHESAGDLVAIVASLHFHSVIDRLLASTRGNLFTVNELDRVGELDKSRQIRIAFNSLRMSDVGTEPHERSLPLTGGIFDILVEVFQKKLVARSLISESLAARSTQGTDPRRDQDMEAVQRDFDAAYAGNGPGFKEALLEARDYLGLLLAKTWSGMNPDFLSYHDILRKLLRADRELGQEHQETIRSCFAWREIMPSPGSMLLRPHSLRECGLDATGSVDRNVAEARNARALEEVVRRVLGEMAEGDARDVRASAQKPGRARKANKK